MIWYDMIYFLTAIGLTPGGSSTVHIYTQTIHRTTQSTQTIYRTTQYVGRCAIPYGQMDGWVNVIRLIFAFAAAFQTHLNMCFALTCIGMVCFIVQREC
jgi:hypothetical protein